MNDSINKYTYLDTLVSDIIPFAVNPDSGPASLQVAYDIDNVPEFLAVIVSYLHTTASGVQVEVIKCEGKYSIERNKEITGEELYLLVDHAVENLNLILQDAALKQQIPEVEAACPEFAEMEADLDELARRLEELYI